MALGAAGAMGLTISLPAIQEELGMPEADLQWVSSVYNLTAGCFLLLAGRIADIHGRKLVFVSGRVHVHEVRERGWKSDHADDWRLVDHAMDAHRRVHAERAVAGHHSGSGGMR
jgi:hypothetical protein